jgi:DNA polymerase
MKLLSTIETIDTFYTTPMEAMSSCLRGFIIPEDGHVFIGADFNAIEARVLAWLAGEEKVLDIFRGHGKIYEHAAAGIYGVPLDSVTKDQRTIGKVAILALGFGGGVGAFQNMARVYGVSIPDAQADSVKVAWRNANPNIVRYWRELEDAARAAIVTPGKVFAAGAAGRKIQYRVKGSFLQCRLPSGRIISYPYPSLQMKEKWGQMKETICFKGEGLNRKWEEQDTYGGKLCENVTQAVASDLLREALIRCEEAGYPVVLHVHDEIVCEHIARPEMDLAGLKRDFELVVEAAPEWAAGLPIAAEGFIARRYQK